jgi:Sec-independent protein secretion pathway component TatC
MISQLPRRTRAPEPDPKYMTVVGHLEELRRRLIVCIVSVAFGAVAGWFLAPGLILVLVGLSAARIISSGWLSSKRLMFFFGIFVFATVITPGADFISPLILGGILYVLFECSIIISRLVGR